MNNPKRSNPAGINGDANVGYRKPSEHGRFKPGQSGNPRGRPMGARNFKTVLKAILRIPVKVTRDGKPRKVSTQEAALLRLREKALSGVTRELLQLILLAQAYNNEELAEARSLSANDETILQIFKARVLSGAAAACDSAEDCGRALEGGQPDKSNSSGEVIERRATKRVRLKRRLRSKAGREAAVNRSK
jgi:hypothetical protein